MLNVAYAHLVTNMTAEDRAKLDAVLFPVPVDPETWGTDEQAQREMEAAMALYAEIGG